jgi:hypothetical protein
MPSTRCTANSCRYSSSRRKSVLHLILGGAAPGVPGTPAFGVMGWSR